MPFIQAMERFANQTRRVPVGRTLRLIVQTAAIVHWTSDDWASVGKSDTVASGFTGLHFFDLPTAELARNGPFSGRQQIVGKAEKTSERRFFRTMV